MRLHHILFTLKMELSSCTQEAKAFRSRSSVLQPLSAPSKPEVRASAQATGVAVCVANMALEWLLHRLGSHTGGPPKPSLCPSFTQ